MAECLESMHFLTFTLAFSLLLRTEVCCGTVTNVALGKSCWQSTTKGPSNASLAVDGLRETCAVTSEEKGSRWSLDLGGKHTVTSVTVDAGEDELGYVEILVTNAQEGDNKNDLCALPQPTESTSKETFDCYSPIEGRYVHITSPFTTSLKLCEVSVNECEDGLYGSKCDKVCHCKENVACSKATGLCPGRCAPGYMGRTCQEACTPGMFGMDCLKMCHCKADKEFCNIEDGACPSGCAETYLGRSCQTQIPFIDKAPVSQSKNPTSITLRWDPWKGELDTGMRIDYEVEYRLHQRHTPHPTWEKWEPKIVQGQQNIMVARIDKLKISTHYNFRVTPFLYEGETEHKGGTSPNSKPYKTTCAAPEPPDIVNVEAMVDEGRNKALLNVQWTMLSESDVHCDSIKVYRVQYRKSGSIDWETVLASLNTDVKNITGLEFSKEYYVQVVAVNNQDYTGFSSLYKVITPDSSGAKAPWIAQPVISETDSSGILAGTIIGLVFSLIAVIFVAFFIYKRRQRKYNSVPDTSDHMEEKVPLNNVVTGSEMTGNCIGDKPEGDKDSEVDKLTMLGEPKHQGTIKVEELEQYIMERNTNDREKLRGEYEEIPMGFTAKYEQGKSNANKHKNRFVNIIPYDHSRLILDKTEGDPDSDYINANYIDGYKNPKAFVAAQGCNKYTIQDMWRMVWQVNSRRIIMITNLIENGKRKCDQYWPENGETKQYLDIVVHNIETETTSDFIIRTFDLSKEGEKRTVKQFHFVAWPDHGVPTRASPIIAFRRKVRAYDDTFPGTIVVHCSAGVGRTGTFITLDALLDMAHDEGLIDVFGWVWNMRRDRVNMIQTVEQYLFVYDALLEALKAGNTAFGCSEFREKYEEMKKIDPEKGQSKLQQQFSTLAAMSPQVKSDDVKSGLLPENAIKNRNQDVLPADRHRPYLMLRVEGTNDYINAVFLDGFRKRNSYIITQMPLPITVIDFWRMVYEHGCCSIIMLNPMDENDETFGQYWLEDEGCECGPFIIEPHSTDTTNADITVREIKLTFEPQTASVLPPTKKDEAPRIITQFQLNCWPMEDSVPRSKQAVIQLIDLVEKCQQKTGDGPVIIHCRDGVEQSGLYVAVSCIWEKMKVDQEVDIFNTVKHLRFHRPQILANLEQYEFCYEMVLAYLAEFETYANFR